MLSEVSLRNYTLLTRITSLGSGIPDACVTRPIGFLLPPTQTLFAGRAGVVFSAPSDARRGILACHFDPAGGSRQPLTPQCVRHGNHLMRLEDGESMLRLAVGGMVCAGTRRDRYLRGVRCRIDIMKRANGRDSHRERSFFPESRSLMRRDHDQNPGTMEDFG